MFRLPAVTIIDRTSGARLGDRIRFADTALARLVGLLGVPRLQEGEGLLLAPSSGIHTLGMRFPIDVIALDRTRKVRRLWHNLPPWRVLRPSARTSMIVELPAGVLVRQNVAIGDELSIAVQEPPET